MLLQKQFWKNKPFVHQIPMYLFFYINWINKTIIFFWVIHQISISIHVWDWDISEIMKNFAYVLLARFMMD